jgi:hypothetical protein
MLRYGAITTAVAVGGGLCYYYMNQSTDRKKKVFTVVFAKNDGLIPGKEVKVKLLKPMSDLDIFHNRTRHKLKDRFPNDKFDHVRMNSHLTLMEKEEFDKLVDKDALPKTGEEWKSYVPPSSVSDIVMARATSLEETQVTPNVVTGKKSIGLEFNVPHDNTTTHMTIAYYSNGLPSEAKDFVEEQLLE